MPSIVSNQTLDEKPALDQSKASGHDMSNLNSSKSIKPADGEGSRSPGRSVRTRYIANKWNMEYAKAMDKVGNQRMNARSVRPSLYSKNQGTSYFVAPINLSTNPKIIKIQQNNQDYLQNYNKKYFSKHGYRETQQSASVNEDASESMLSKKKKSTNESLVKTQNLNKLFESNKKIMASKEQRDLTPQRSVVTLSKNQLEGSNL